MGCSASKQQEAAVGGGASTSRKEGGEPSALAKQNNIRKTNAEVYTLLMQQLSAGATESPALRKLRQVKVTTAHAAYCNPTTSSTPLHLSCRLLDHITDQEDAFLVIPRIIQQLCALYPQACQQKDASGHLPLHYAIAPSSVAEGSAHLQNWKVRSQILQRILQSTDPSVREQYLSSNQVNFYKQPDAPLCSPLYRALQLMPDDFTSTSRTSPQNSSLTPDSPTVHFLHTLLSSTSELQENPDDHDSPLALLYRRFTRQFDMAEKFFPGDNSHPDILHHRQQYKRAAAHTWAMIEMLLQYSQKSSSFRIVHAAVQTESIPPDLLRYIVETSAHELAIPDEETGNLPLHFSVLRKSDTIYNKYIVDELLYKFPQAASIPNKKNEYPLTLAVRQKKSWVAGGLSSLYNAFPEALQQINTKEYPGLQRALSIDQEDDNNNTKETKEEDALGIVQDEQHDAIMLVQQRNVSIAQVTACMWAHEEDPGVQMLGCVAISQMKQSRTALLGVSAVVNAMKAHPNEVIVQEKACVALQLMAPFDGQVEVSFVASGAISAIVGAMQAHINDENVQEEACKALSDIVLAGGADRATIVASVSGLTAIINSLAAHPRSEAVQESACQALVAMTAFNDANVPPLPATQTEPLLLAAKENFPDTCAKFSDKLLAKLA